MPTNISYASIANAIAITSADGNGDGVWCSSAIVDNDVTDTQFMDHMINGSIQVGTVTADGTIDIYAAVSADGVEFTGGVDAGDVDITWGTTGNTTVNGEFSLILLASINVDATDDDNDIPFTIPSLVAACGQMPKEYCIVIENNTGVALHATGTNNHLEWTGIEYVSS